MLCCIRQTNNNRTLATKATVLTFCRCAPARPAACSQIRPHLCRSGPNVVFVAALTSVAPAQSEPSVLLSQALFFRGVVADKRQDATCTRGAGRSTTGDPIPNSVQQWPRQPVPQGALTGPPPCGRASCYGWPVHAAPLARLVRDPAHWELVVVRGPRAKGTAITTEITATSCTAATVQHGS